MALTQVERRSERERERERERETDRQTDRDRDRETEREEGGIEKIYWLIEKHVKPSRVILWLKVRESRSFYRQIKSFVRFFPLFFFVHVPLEFK